jgi:hypothetical protein
MTSALMFHRQKRDGRFKVVSLREESVKEASLG